jgi:hypothetical protein
MRRTRRNIPDAFSPESPVLKREIAEDRIQDELEDNTPVEEIVKPHDKKQTPANNVKDDNPSDKNQS